MSSGAGAGATAPHRRVLLIVVALILYGSLYPWQFQMRHYAESPLGILLHSWPHEVDRYLFWDVAINLALYVPLGVFAFLAVSEGASRFWKVCLPLVLALVLSASIEMLQLFDDHRQCSLSDVASNVAGAAIGIGLGALYRRALERLILAQSAATLLRPSGALLLLCCWVGYQIFPLFPAWGRTSLFRRIAALADASSLSPVETLLVFAEWLAVACLLDSIFKAKASGFLIALMLLVPARLFVANRTVGWPDIAGAGCALAVWLGAPRKYVRRSAPVLLTGAVLLGELAPFHFQAAQPFNWVPFRGFFSADWQSGFVLLFRKSFCYGSLLWLWRGAGCSLAWATAMAAVALFVLERVQVYLPGRTPEVTDAVLAVLMGVLLWLLQDA